MKKVLILVTSFALFSAFAIWLSWRFQFDYLFEIVFLFIFWGGAFVVFFLYPRRKY